MKTVSKQFRMVLRVHGIFGRNRSVKSKSWTVCSVPQEPAPDVPALLPAWRAKIAEVGVKGGIVKLQAEPVEVQEFGDGQLHELWDVFATRVLHEERIEGGGVRVRARSRLRRRLRG